MIEEEINRDLEKYRSSLDTRKFEIDLFWKRSLFFWGFIAATFVAYAKFKEQSSYLSLIIANFGMVCSYAWTMVNRGSKYWQENWEQKVDQTELMVTGPLFRLPEEEQRYKFFWLRARKYSVSKLAIALSDYVFFLWLCIVAFEVLSLSGSYIDIIILGKIFTLFSLVYVFAMGMFGKTSSFKNIRKNYNLLYDIKTIWKQFKEKKTLMRFILLIWLAITLYVLLFKVNTLTSSFIETMITIIVLIIVLIAIIFYWIDNEPE